MIMSPPYSRSSARAATQDDEIQPLLRGVESSSYSNTSAMASKDAETIVVAPDAKPGADDAALAEAIRLEHNLTFSQAVKLYPAAIGWSAFVSIGVIMLAFDPQLLGNLYATPQFQRDFGYEYEGSVSCCLLLDMKPVLTCYSISLVCLGLEFLC